MKKLLIFIIAIIELTGCSSIQKLRVNYKPASENYHLYYYDKSEKGHNQNVKYERISNKNVNITIPVKYSEKQIGTIPKHLPNALRLFDLNTTFKQIGTCDGFFKKPSTYGGYNCDYCCLLRDDKLVITLQYDKNEIYYKYFSFNDPFKEINIVDAGIIVDYKVLPEELFIDCDKNSCAVMDKNNRPVNEILISKIISIDPKKINAAIEKDKKEQEEFEKLEKQRKAEEAKKKAEEDRKWREKRRLQKKECPGLYRTLYWAQQTGYIDPIVGLKTAQRFEELGCVFWLQEQTNGY